MLRSALFVVALIIPSTAMADKIVNADGDSFVEVETQVDATSILDRLNPVNPAEAQSSSKPPFQARPSANVPQMRELAPEDVDAFMKPDYT